jgi:hypothetical protein
MALPVTEYLNATIIIQLSIKLPLLAAWHTSFACPKEVSRKRHPTMPALRAPCAARQWRDAKNSLTLRQVWRFIPPPARRHQTGAANMRVPFSGRCFPEEPKFLLKS